MVNKTLPRAPESSRTYGVYTGLPYPLFPVAFSAQCLLGDRLLSRVWRSLPQWVTAPSDRTTAFNTTQRSSPIPATAAGVAKMTRETTPGSLCCRSLWGVGAMSKSRHQRGLRRAFLTLPLPGAQHVREKFTCRDCEKITQAPVPFHVIARGLVGPSLLAMILFEKFGQHPAQSPSRALCQGCGFQSACQNQEPRFPPARNSNLTGW